MHRQYKTGRAWLLLLGALLAGCVRPEAAARPAAGQRRSFRADGLSFTMVHVPAARFFTGIDDAGTASVPAGFWIGETELSYELWSAVTAWAAAERGYEFANPGIAGSDGRGGSDQPVTTVNSRDAVVFGNALTEWLNAKTLSRRTCVFRSGREALRDARANGGAAVDAALPDPEATGFRPPTGDEWELAARYIGDFNGDGDIMDPGEYYPGDFASGSAAPVSDIAATGRVAVFAAAGTNPVKSRAANALGIFDLSGNVGEWCIGWYPGYAGTAKLSRGGNWLVGPGLNRLGLMNRQDPYTENSLIGIRLALGE